MSQSGIATTQQRCRWKFHVHVDVLSNCCDIVLYSTECFYAATKWYGETTTATTRWRGKSYEILWYECLLSAIDPFCLGSKQWSTTNHQLIYSVYGYPIESDNSLFLSFSICKIRASGDRMETVQVDILQGSRGSKRKFQFKWIFLLFRAELKINVFFL